MPKAVLPLAEGFGFLVSWDALAKGDGTKNFEGQKKPAGYVVPFYKRLEVLEGRRENCRNYEKNPKFTAAPNTTYGFRSKRIIAIRPTGGKEDYCRQ